MSPELRWRLTLGPVLGAVVIGTLWLDFETERRFGSAILLGLLVVACGRELRRLAHAVAPPVQYLPTIAISLALVGVAWAQGDVPFRTWLSEHSRYVLDRLAGMPIEVVLIALGMVWTVLIQMSRRAFEHFFTNVALTIFGMVYVGITAHLLMRLASLPADPAYYGGAAYPNRGAQLVLVFLTAVKFGDITAFFGGKLLGRHKMAPRISPGKTWEGFACSFVGAIGGTYGVCAALGALCAQPPFNSWWQPLVWGLVLGPMGVVGDLAESCMKREAMMKDSGRMLPGFGGWLDLFDAVVLAAPVAYVLALVL